MGTPTEKFGLIKPGSSDSYNWETMNSNWGLIENAAVRAGTDLIFDSAETAITGTHFAFNSGWSKYDGDTQANVIRRFGEWCYIYFKVKSNSDISISTNDDIPNQEIGVLTTNWRPQQITSFKGPLGSGRLLWGYIGTSGEVVITAISGGNAGTDLSAGSVMSFALYFKMAVPSAASSLTLIDSGPSVNFPLGDYNANLASIDSEFTKAKVHLPHDLAPNTGVNWIDYNNSEWERFGTGNRVIRRGIWGYVEASFNYKGAEISNGSTGDIGNRKVATLNLPWRPAQHTPMGTMGEGRLAGGYLDKNGGIYLTSMANSGNFKTNHKLNLSCWYILEAAV